MQINKISPNFTGGLVKINSEDGFDKYIDADKITQVNQSIHANKGYFVYADYTFDDNGVGKEIFQKSYLPNNMNVALHKINDAKTTPGKILDLSS